MRKKILALVLSLVMVLSTLAPALTADVYAEEGSVVYEYEEASVVNPVSNSWHETTGESGDGPAAWAFDNNSGTHWHSNYTSTNGANKHCNEFTWATVSTIPAYSEVSSSRAWIGAEFEEAVNVARVEYTGRTNKPANWYGQYALYVANVTDGEVKDSDFELAASGTNSGFSKVIINLETPKTATHFRLVAFTANPNGNNFVSASEIDVFKAVVADTTPKFGGSIVNPDKQYTDARLKEVEELTKTSESLTAWKNDRAVSEIALFARYLSYDNVAVTVEDLKDADGNTISKDNVTASFIRSTKAYNGGYLGYGDKNRVIPADNGTNRSESADIIWSSEPVTIAENTVQPIWVEFAIPETAEAGIYTTTVTVTADDLATPLKFDYTVEVQDAVLTDAEDYSFDIMQWQYPYSSAEYYGVDAFSEEHFEILVSNMGIYKEVGGNAVTTTFTEEAWSGQTYSANDVHYPSMVKWTKNADGSFTYDYSDFDAWVLFCKEMGLGDKIVAYGIAPWHGSFTYWENGTLKYERYTVGNTRYNEVWTAFLTDFAAHLEEKEWKENVYIGIDERGVSEAAFNCAEAVGLKTAADIDNIGNHWAIAQRVTELNVGDTAAQSNGETFTKLLKIRNEKGYRTTLYSCTEHQPGNFSLSAPVESYWTVLNAGMMGVDGFNRWAFDAWVANPLNDATHNSFEPGDCFVIFPDEKDAENPTSKYSVRLARMAEGVRDVNKLEQIAKEIPFLSNKVDQVYENIQYTLRTSRSYLDDSAVEDLAAETHQFKADLNELTEQYVLLKNETKGLYLAETAVEMDVKDTYQINTLLISDKANKTLTYTSADEKVATVDEDGIVTAVGRGTTTIIVENKATGYKAEVEITVSVEISIINKLRKFVLPEKYQSNVEGAASNEEGTLVGTDRQYLGQPDMVQTETGRLITVFPTGHGHGPLIMKISEDEGETWIEKTDTPESWKDSQETPTIYSLKVDDGKGGLKERLVLICACPGTWGNYTTGWDFSYSDDNGDTWSEFEHFWSKFSNGKTNDVIVGMASLVQLKDADGNYIQKWMGVYHSGQFVNYKTYLTFDENGKANWTEPVAYLSDYRAIESSHQICEVGMFRSPDGERIVALGRNQTHTGPATMFYSDDEGETWTEPVELPGSLAGERHKAKYDPITGKLLITFREIDYDRNNNGVWEGGSDWIAGEWVAWVGTYEDLMNLQQGDYMLILDEDFANNYYSGDTGYTGMAVLEDGTFVLHSYGHWDQAFSNSYTDGGSYNVKTDLCWIRQAKFNLAELEAELEVDKEPEIPADPSDDSRDLSLDDMTAISDSQYLPGTSNEGPDDYILDNNEMTHWHTNWATSEATDVAKRWVGVSFDEATAIGGIRYLPRQGSSSNGAVTSYKIQYRAADDGEWIDLAEGTWSWSEKGWQLVEFDKVVAKQVRVVGVGTYADSGNNAHMSVAELRVLEAKEDPVVPPVEDEEEVVRLFGSGRYETGYAVADSLKAALGVDKFEAVVVATGKNFADALAGSYLAVERHAPILLTNGNADNVETLHAYIRANVAEGGTVYILGGEGAVPTTVDAIEGYKVERLFGDSRYDTNLAILEEAGVAGDSIIVATGKTFADSLSASAAKLPILLVKPNAALNDAQKEILAGIKNIYIVGGEGAVSTSYEAELKAFGKVTRVFGESRYDTSVAVAKTFCKDVEKVVVASGKNFPDGLCGGPLAAALGAPLVLTKDGGAGAAAAYVAENAVASGFVLGGDGALADATVVEVFGLDSAAEIK